MTGRAAGVVLAALFAAPAFAAEDYDQGKALFERQWEAAGGAGPLFNAKSCNGCHKDGGPSRVFQVGGNWIARGAVVRIGTPRGEPDPRYGGQLQDLASDGLTPEARISYTFDGLPAASIRYLDGPPDAKSETEIRLAPSLRGRAWMDRVDAKAILALEDATDADSDGVSGRARKLFGGAVGRFGHTADMPSLAAQTAAAASADMGLSSPARPDPFGDCTALQVQCRAAGHSGIELTDDEIALIAAFAAALPAPVPAAPPPAFAEAGCAACHVPALPDADGGPLPVFTDFLLHDMGEALSGAHGGDGFSRLEWRTAPLIDLAPRDGFRRYLHDGRATSIDEAIRLHGGEGEGARRKYEALAGDVRARLIDYLGGL